MDVRTTAFPHALSNLISINLVFKTSAVDNAFTWPFLKINRHFLLSRLCHYYAQQTNSNFLSIETALWFFFFLSLLKKAFLGNIQQCHSNAGSTETFTIEKKEMVMTLWSHCIWGWGEKKKLIGNWILQNVRMRRELWVWAEREKTGRDKSCVF